MNLLLLLVLEIVQPINAQKNRRKAAVCAKCTKLFVRILEDKALNFGDFFFQSKVILMEFAEASLSRSMSLFSTKVLYF